eukprot:TRINITY_DN26295_c0_g1_i1.p1 TRINITY_DN26295_c0_g1~~TRINITY_DN26295_c0_g1_i1.p1  ORF type:complete len:566 (+),score=80.73 TRINITY_DN26295_c0_g1_i1:62-1759(+)
MMRARAVDHSSRSGPAPSRVTGRNGSSNWKERGGSLGIGRSIVRATILPAVAAAMLGLVWYSRSDWDEVVSAHVRTGSPLAVTMVSAGSPAEVLSVARSVQEAGATFSGLLVLLAGDWDAAVPASRNPASAVSNDSAAFVRAAGNFARLKDAVSLTNTVLLNLTDELERFGVPERHAHSDYRRYWPVALMAGLARTTTKTTVFFSKGRRAIPRHVKNALMNRHYAERFRQRKEREMRSAFESEEGSYVFSDKAHTDGRVCTADVLGVRKGSPAVAHIVDWNFKRLLRGDALEDDSRLFVASRIASGFSQTCLPNWLSHFYNNDRATPDLHPKPPLFSLRSLSRVLQRQHLQSTMFVGQVEVALVVVLPLVEDGKRYCRAPGKDSCDAASALSELAHAFADSGVRVGVWAAVVDTGVRKRDAATSLRLLQNLRQVRRVTVRHSLISSTASRRYGSLLSTAADAAMQSWSPQTLCGACGTARLVHGRGWTQAVADVAGATLSAGSPPAVACVSAARHFAKRRYFVPPDAGSLDWLRLHYGTAAATSPALATAAAADLWRGGGSGDVR